MVLPKLRFLQVHNFFVFSPVWIVNLLALLSLYLTFLVQALVDLRVALLCRDQRRSRKASPAHIMVSLRAKGASPPTVVPVWQRHLIDGVPRSACRAQGRLVAQVLVKRKWRLDFKERLRSEARLVIELCRFLLAVEDAVKLLLMLG